MDTFVFYCPHCKQKIEADELLRGKIVKCPCCKEEIVIDIECFWEEDNNGEYNISNEDNNKATIDDNNLENNDIEDDENNISLEDNLDNNNDEIDPHKQCKLCRGKLDIDDGTYVYVCPNCAKLITFPLYRDEKIAELYTTAENFCQEKEYGKAYSVYEMIISETPDDPAAYWGMLLSKFGVEYVKIPESETYVPYYSLKTDECILNDITFLTILDIAEPDIAKLYQSEALRIIPNQNAVKKQKELKLKEQYNHLLEHLNLEFKLNDNPELLASLRKNINETKKALKKVKTLDETELEAIIECNIQVLKYSGNLDEKIERIRIKRENLRKKTIKATKLLFTVLAVLVICYYTIQAGSYAVSKYSLWSGNVCLTKDGVIVGFKYDKNLIKNCVIPDNVTKITSNTFKGCSKLQKLEIPASVKEIEENAFENCTALKNISLPNGITKIKAGTFRGCSSLQKLIIPASVKEIEENAFENCYALKNISLPNGISKIAAATFKGCSSLEELIIPATVTEIEEKAFKNCSALRKISLPKGISKIAASTFRGCKNLQELSIPSTVTEIEESAFENCSRLWEFSLPKGISKIAASTFRGCSSLRKLTIPSTVTEIEEGAFENCKNLRTLLSLDSQYEKKHSYSRHVLSGLVIPYSVKKIGERAFYDCGTMKTSYGRMAGKYVVAIDCKIENYPFYFSDIVTRISSQGKEYSIYPLEGNLNNQTKTFPFPENCGSNKFHIAGDERLKSCTIIYLSQTGAKYFIDAEKGDAKSQYLLGYDCLKNNYLEGAKKWLKKSAENNYAPAQKLLSQLKDKEMKSKKHSSLGLGFSKNSSTLKTLNNKKITAIKIPPEVRQIKQGTFKKCNPSLVVTISKNITSIEEAAFTGVKKVISENELFPVDENGVLIDKKNKKLLFAPPTLQKEYKIPKTVTKIGKEAFFNCSLLKEITIPPQITSIGYAAFAGINKVISNNETFIVDENGALLDKKRKELLYVPPTLKEEYKIPHIVRHIGHKAFFNCSLLKEIIIPGSIKFVNIEEFNSCKNLKTLILQNGVKYFNTFSFNVTPLNIEFMDLPPSITEVNFSRRFSSFLPKLKRIRLSKQTKVSGKTPKVLSFYD